MSEYVEKKVTLSNGVELPITEGSVAKYSLMKEDYILLKYNSGAKLSFPYGTTMSTNQGAFDSGAKSIIAPLYELMEPYGISFDSAINGWRYELRFDAWYMRMKDFIFMLPGKDAEGNDYRKEIKWSLTGKIADHLEVINKNLDLAGIKYQGRSLQVVFSPDDRKTIDYNAFTDTAQFVEYDNCNIFDALNNICDKWGCEWYVLAHKIYIGRLESNEDATEITIGTQAKNIEPSSSMGKFANTVYALGGTKNMSSTYGKKLEFEVSKSGNVVTDNNRIMEIDMFSNKSNLISTSRFTYPIDTISVPGQNLSANSLKNLYFDSISGTKRKDISFIDEYKFEYQDSLTPEGQLPKVSTVKLFEEKQNVKVDVPLNFVGTTRLHLYFYAAWISNQSTLQRRITAKISYGGIVIGVMTYGGADVAINSKDKANISHDASGLSVCFSGLISILMDTTKIEEYIPNEKINIEFTCDQPYGFMVFSTNLAGSTSSSLNNRDSLIAFYSTYYSANITLKKVVNGTEDDTVYNATYNKDRKPYYDNESKNITIDNGTTFSTGDKYVIKSGLVTGYIPAKYYSASEDVDIVNLLTEPRVKLPNGALYVQAEGVTRPIEEAVIFDDIYPHTESTITAVKTVDYTETIIDDVTKEPYTKPITAWMFQSDLSFSNDYVPVGGDLHITFSDGDLAGLTFEVVYNPAHAGETWSASGSWFEIYYNEDYGTTLPNNTLKPKTGDKFVLYGFDASFFSASMLKDAEDALEKRALAYLEKLMHNDRMYNVTLNPTYATTSFPELGQKFILDTPDSNSAEMRVLGYEIKLDISVDSPKFICGEQAKYSRLESIEKSISKL